MIVYVWVATRVSVADPKAVKKTLVGALTAVTIVSAVMESVYSAAPMSAALQLRRVLVAFVRVQDVVQ